MIVVSVMYGHQEGARFDWDYYPAQHLPLVREAFGPTGLVSATALKGIGSAEGGPPVYTAVALLTFTDMAALQASMGGPRVGEVVGDVPNFTDLVPVRQISEAV